LIHKIGYEFASNLAFCSESAHLEEALTEVLKFLGKYHRSENTQDNLLRYFYSQSQEALIETKLPYPQTFIQGFLLSIVKKYQPKFAIKTQVILLNEQNSSSILKNNYLYQINWTMV
jgi:hypothetical protein